jgi:hypothetical protein
MKQIKKSLQFFLLCMVCLMTPLVAQSGDTPSQGAVDQKQRAASAIFDDIMLTLPGDMKAKVDSAAASGKSSRTARNVPCAKNDAAGQARSSSNASADKRDGAVSGLPDDVRGQVEKAMTDIDLMNENRQVQFKEYEKKHPGSR